MAAIRGNTEKGSVAVGERGFVIRLCWDGQFLCDYQLQLGEQWKRGKQVAPERVHLEEAIERKLCCSTSPRIMRRAESGRLMGFCLRALVCTVILQGFLN